MSLKAAGCGLPLKFSIDMVRRCGGPPVFGDDLLKAGISLTQILNIIRLQRCQVSGLGKGMLLEAAQTHLVSCKLAGVDYTPKSHPLCRMLDRSRIDSPTPPRWFL
eukprot:6367336-Pyramimonas_sp.AAC.1